MSYTRSIETNGYGAFRDHDPEIEDGSEIVDHGYKILGYDQNGIEILDHVGDKAGAQFWRSGREQGIPPTVAKKNGSWSLGAVPCIMTNRGLVPIKSKSLDQDFNYSGKFCKGKEEDFTDDDPVDNVLSVTGEDPQEGDIGLVVQCLNQKEEQFLFFPLQKKNDLDPLPIPTICHGGQDFVTQSIELPLKVETSIELEEGEQFFFTNLFRTKNLIVTNKENVTLLSPLEIATGSIIAKSFQQLTPRQAQNCGGVLNNTFMYVPNLVPAVITDNAGNKTQVWAVHSDGVNDLIIESSCCDSEEENQGGGEENFPDFLRYQDSFGITQHLARTSDNEFGPRYTSRNMTIDDPFPLNEFPVVDLVSEPNGFHITLFYPSLDDNVTPSQSAAVIAEKNRQQGEFGGFGEIGPFGVDRATVITPQGLEGQYTTNATFQIPPGFFANITKV